MLQLPPKNWEKLRRENLSYSEGWGVGEQAVSASRGQVRSELQLRRADTPRAARPSPCRAQGSAHPATTSPPHLQPSWEPRCHGPGWKCAAFCQASAVSLPNIIVLISCRFQYKSFGALLLGNLCKYISHMERCVSLDSEAVNDAASQPPYKNRARWQIG